MARWLLRKCAQCKRYTLKEDRCPKCGGPVAIPHPPKYSAEDKYAKYRRAMKKALPPSKDEG